MSCMKDQYVNSTWKHGITHRVVVKKKYVQKYRGKTESTESLANRISDSLHKHAQQQLNEIKNGSMALQGT